MCSQSNFDLRTIASTFFCHWKRTEAAYNIRTPKLYKNTNLVTSCFPITIKFMLLYIYRPRRLEKYRQPNIKISNSYGFCYCGGKNCTDFKNSCSLPSTWWLSYIRLHVRFPTVLSLVTVHQFPPLRQQSTTCTRNEQRVLSVSSSGKVASCATRDENGTWTCNSDCHGTQRHFSWIIVTIPT
jgi:hypothetical protein